MLENTSIKIRNYKCFGDVPQGFNKILPFNIIIGKNNSGKSSLIELIENTIALDDNFFLIKSNDKPLEIEICEPLSKETIGNAFQPGTRGGNVPNNIDHFQFGKAWIGSKVRYSIGSKGSKNVIEFEKPFVHGIHESRKIVQFLQPPLQGKIFKKILSERDILPEQEITQPIGLKNNGEGATNLIQDYLNSAAHDGKLIKRTLFQELNKIVNPEISFNDISIQRDANRKWEIYLEDLKGNVIPLSKMGSGIKTILLVLLNLYIIPNLEKKELSQYVFAFEELENNLHPSLQRKLFNYLRLFSKEKNCIFFLTTHSSIVIDLFNKDEGSQIIHVVQTQDRGAITNDTITYSDSKKILEDLDIRASDLLQSNGIIWVEGPSDRNYLNKWISLLDPTLQDGIHYSIMFYGGRLLSRVHFLPDFLNQELIPLLLINKNSFVIIDRDAKKISSELNNTKERIKKEIGSDLCWITHGREIENYLSKKTLKRWLEKRENVTEDFDLDKYQKIEESISKVSSIKYEQGKTESSNEIVEFVDVDDLNIFDLKEQVSELITNIKKWNKL